MKLQAYVVLKVKYLLYRQNVLVGLPCVESFSKYDALPKPREFIRHLLLYSWTIFNQKVIIVINSILSKIEQATSAGLEYNRNINSLDVPGIEDTDLFSGW